MRSYFYAGLQLLIAATLILPLYLVSQMLREINPGRLSVRISRGPYYWAVVQKRRALGEPEWQEHDLAIGIPDPSLFLTPGAEISGPPAAPKCVACREPIYGYVISERCVGCWSELVNERLEIK